MTAQMPSQLDNGNTSASFQQTNRLALTSWRLSLISLALWALTILSWLAVANVPPPAFLNNLTGYWGTTLVFGFVLVEAVLFFGGLGFGIGGLVTANSALKEAKRYPPQLARKGFAIAGLVIGILEVFMVCAIVGLEVLGLLTLL